LRSLWSLKLGAPSSSLNPSVPLCTLFNPRPLALSWHVHAPRFVRVFKRHLIWLFVLEQRSPVEFVVSFRWIKKSAFKGLRRGPRMPCLYVDPINWRSFEAINIKKKNSCQSWPILESSPIPLQIEQNSHSNFWHLYKAFIIYLFIMFCRELSKAKNQKKKGQSCVGVSSLILRHRSTMNSAIAIHIYPSHFSPISSSSLCLTF